MIWDERSYVMPQMLINLHGLTRWFGTTYFSHETSIDHPDYITIEVELTGADGFTFDMVRPMVIRNGHELKAGVVDAVLTVSTRDVHDKTLRVRFVLEEDDWTRAQPEAGDEADARPDRLGA